MEPDPADTGSLERPAPAVANRVLVWRIFPVAAEDPRRWLGLNAIAGDVAGKQLDQLRCEEDGSLAAALRRPQLDAALVGSLDLSHHGQLLAEEVEAVELPVGLRPHIKRAFEAEDVTLDFFGFSGETLQGAMQEPPARK
ncbi:MAG: hypothetical protein ACYDDU_02260 [Dermatophilaceae bacterium]